MHHQTLGSDIGAEEGAAVEGYAAARLDGPGVRVISRSPLPIPSAASASRPNGQPVIDAVDPQIVDVEDRPRRIEPVGDAAGIRRDAQAPALPLHCRLRLRCTGNDTRAESHGYAKLRRVGSRCRGGSLPAAAPYRASASRQCSDSRIRRTNTTFCLLSFCLSLNRPLRVLSRADRLRRWTNRCPGSTLHRRCGVGGNCPARERRLPHRPP